MEKLTEKQFKIFEFIKDFIKENRYPPSMREVGKQFDITVRAVSDHFKRIEKKGYIERESGKSRAIKTIK